MTTIESFGFGDTGYSYEDAEVVVIGAPFDGTSSYRPGARFAPNAIRAALFGIESYSPYQDKDMCNVRLYDCGDLGLPYGNAERSLEIIEERVDTFISDGKLPFMIGGEHLVTLGAVRALRRKYDGLRIVHIDAHTDLMDDYMGEKLSHATVMRRVCELVGDGKIYQYGIRSGKRHEFEYARERTHMQRFDLRGLECISGIVQSLPVYLTVDLDVLDPSVFPGTGAPEAGGVSFKELLDALIGLSGMNIVGCDMVELSPGCDPSGVSTITACKLLREMVLVL